MKTLSRRQFLASALALGASIVSGLYFSRSLSNFLSPGPFSNTPRSQQLRQTLLQYMNPAETKPIGTRYLKQFPEENDPAKLIELVFSSLSDSLTADRPDPEDLRGLLSKRIREDFSRGRTVTLKGWALSRTEARLCALTVFLAQ